MRESLAPPANGRTEAVSTSTQRVGVRAVRRRMVLLAVTPAGLVAVLGAAVCGVVAYRAGDALGGVDAPTGASVLVGALLTIAVLTAAGFIAAAQARTITGRAAELGRVEARRHAAVTGPPDQPTLWRLPPQPTMRRPEQPPAADSTIEMAAIKAAPATATPGGGEAGAREEPVEVFVNLARRLQSLVHREIGLLDELENEHEDPDLLKGLFQVDHLATRVRRYAENLAVLGGAVSHRQWTRPVSVSDVLRSAVAEIEQYTRVKLVPPVPGTVRGHAVADVVHLIAELAENATRFSPPQTRVLLRAELVTAGLAIEVEDRGLGVAAAEREQLNALLDSPDRAIPGDMLRDGRIGLYVVSALARRHGIRVQLQGNIYGGTQAVLVLPHDVLGQLPAAPQPDETATPPRPPAPAVGSAQAGADNTAMPRRQQAPVRDTVPVAEPRHAAAPSPAADSRPSLPKRRSQANLAPELREPPRVDTTQELEHDPRLMAAFQAGFRAAEDPEDSGTANGAETPRGLGN